MTITDIIFLHDSHHTLGHNILNDTVKGKDMVFLRTKTMESIQQMYKLIFCC